MSMVLDDRVYNGLKLQIQTHVDARVREYKARLDVESRPLCKFFSKGSCTKGPHCPYRHSRSERSIVCKHWLRGLCKKNDQCEFLHEYNLSKMPPCHFFTTFGACSNIECLFLHICPEDHVKDCPWYKRGFCKHGPNCRNRHVRNEPCEDYLAGFCLKGPKCKFGHPKFERPMDDAWVAPPLCYRCGNVGHRPGHCHLAGGAGTRTGPTGNSAPNGGAGPTAPPRRGPPDVTCYKCNRKGHYASSCPFGPEAALQ